MKNSDMLFPYEKVRPIQEDMILAVSKAIQNNKKILVHAPTGIGKTVSVLGPALRKAIDADKTIMMLTARHTQHDLAIQTLKDIKKKYKLNFSAVDIIGKKWMCAVDIVERLSSSEFAEFCKARKEDHLCEFYTNTYSKKELTIRAKKFIADLESQDIKTSEELIQAAKARRLCPYEISLAMTKKAKAIVADYFYLFNKDIFSKFSARSEKEMEDLIVIVDEGHNLADRVRELLSVNLSTYILQRAFNEAKENGYGEVMPFLTNLKNYLVETFANYGKESIIKKVDFIQAVSGFNEGVEYEEFGKETTDTISKGDSYKNMKDELEGIGFEILKSKKKSFILLVAFFLAKWQGQEEGYVRIISSRRGKHELIYTLSYQCLDPSLITKEVIDAVSSMVIMSGTLTPLDFYKDILGFEKDAEAYVYGSPFPHENRMNIVVPKTSTKYSMRNNKQFSDIGKISAEMANNIKGNVMIFFPSYGLRDSIYPFFEAFSEKEIMLELRGMKKEDKINLIEKFKGKKEKGAVLLAVASGSFGEGVDLPGDLLHGVIVVGIPLPPPDLLTKELINYYDIRFGLGWDYGYVLPAITKVLQNAGRCIRSETDKGVIAFLDERYAWTKYMRCFPGDWKVKLNPNPVNDIVEFFKNK
ncbi:MAG: ATP-dependent DNA helicase [Nanoarchaeota archaeon]|nr:ATP-dependent DNA helicase [Nanoarchaeota archaeon]